MSRAGIATFLAVAAAGLATLVIPGSATAASPNISIISAGPTAGNPYVLTITADDANTGVTQPLTSVTVHVASGGTQAYAIPASEMEYVSGPPTAQIWRATQPIPEDHLPPGTYSVTVDATDTSGEADYALPAPGTFSFSWTTNVTATASPSALSYGETTTTISGQVTGYVANSTYLTPVGLAGVPVYVNSVGGSRGPLEIGTTAGDGTYSGQVQLPAADGEYTVSVNATPTMNSGGASLSTSSTSDALRLVGVKVSPDNFTYGQAGIATLTGTVQYQDSVTGWQPLADSPVVVTAGSSDVKFINTTAQGQFTWTFVPDTDGTNWSVEVGGGDLLGTAQSSGTVSDVVPVHFKSFSAKLSPLAELSVKACAEVTAPGALSPQGSMDVQYAAHPGGPWKSLGRVSYDQGTVPSSCGVNTQSYFAGTVPVRLANAYYRGYFPATDSYQRAASRAVHQWKYLTRIVSLRVSPHSVRHGGKITVSGRLQQDNGKWRAFSGQRILIVLRPKGKKQWYWIRKVTTKSSGQFTATFTDPVSASWSAVYDGGRTDFASDGSIHYVKVSGSAAAVRLLPTVSRPVLHYLGALPH